VACDQPYTRQRRLHRLPVAGDFNTPAQGNGLLTLTHQLIAAKLNIANDADSTDIAQGISDADALI